MTKHTRPALSLAMRDVATMQLLADREKGSRLVVLTDTGRKYLSTPLFEV